MKLIAIYIENYSIFRDQLLTFASDYRVTRILGANDDITLSVNYEKKLPDNFFSSDSPNKGCVSSVAAVIGQNGSGKTTIARLMCGLVPWGKRLIVGNVVVLVEIADQLQVYTSYPRDYFHIEVSGGKVLRSIYYSMEEKFEPGPLPFKFFYYSPHYTTEQSDWDLGNEGDSTFNISTTWLMWHPEGNSETLLQNGVSPLRIHDIDEKIRVLEFCEAYRDKEPNIPDSQGVPQRNSHREPRPRFEIPIPQAVIISPHRAGVEHAIGKMRDYVASCRQMESDSQSDGVAATKDCPDQLEDTIGEFLRLLLPSFEKSLGCLDFLTQVFMAYSARYLAECGLLDAHFPVNEIQEGSYLAALKDFILSHSWNQAVNPQAIISFLELNVPPQNAEILNKKNNRELKPYAKEFFNDLAELCGMQEEKNVAGQFLVALDTDDRLYCRLSAKKTRKLIFRLVRLHGLTAIISPFLAFDIYPPMSSGEMAFLSMFARLYRFVRKEMKPEDNAVIFLDEAETTLHPEWQRRLLDYFIHFFEVFIPNGNYQLIFASHSPMLLSDIPAGNCCFLEKCECKREGVETRCAFRRDFHGSDESENTFGANIYDLFKDGLILDSGAIGEFSSRVIDKHLKKLADLAMKAHEKGRDRHNVPDEDMALTQALIGDRMLVRYFEVLKEHGLA